MQEVHDIVIIGSGPAGFTAGLYASRAGYEPLLLAGIGWGGQLMNSYEVENYPGVPKKLTGPQLMKRFRRQAEKFGTKVVEEDAVDVDFSREPFRIETDRNEYLTRSVIIATGASPKWLGLDSEQRLRGKGVSSCATCDGYFFKDRHVAVVGGGDTAMEEALFLAKVCSKVTVIHRRDKLAAEEYMASRALNEDKIEFLWDHEVVEVLGDEKVGGVKVEHVDTGEQETLDVAALFVAIGHTPNTSIFEGEIELDEEGYIERRDTTRTSVEGVFVAGDAYDYVYRQAVTAASSGCKAAMDAAKYLEKVKAERRVVREAA